MAHPPSAISQGCFGLDGINIREMPSTNKVKGTLSYIEDNHLFQSQSVHKKRED